MSLMVSSYSGSSWVSSKRVVRLSKWQSQPKHKERKNAKRRKAEGIGEWREKLEKSLQCIP